MTDTRGFFGSLADRAANSSGGLSFGDTHIPSPIQLLGRLFGGQTYQQFADTHNVGLSESGQQRLYDSIWGQPLMSGLESTESTPSQYEGQEHASMMRPSGHTVSPIAPSATSGQNWHDSQGYDTGWRTGEGGTGLGGGWSTVNTGAEMAALSQMLSNAGGTLGDAVRFNMTPEFGTELLRADGTVRQRGGDSRLIERTGSNRPTTAQEFIRRNPDRWSQMLQQMQQGAGRG